MDNLSQQIVKNYDAYIGGRRSLAAIMAAKVCPKCGQKATACNKAVDSMFLCQGDK
jgi:hypothetical protein